MNIRLFMILIFTVVYGCTDAENVKPLTLFGDIKSYSRLSGNTALNFEEVKSYSLHKGGELTIAFTDSLLPDNQTKVRFLYFNDRLMEIHFIPSQFDFFLKSQFPSLEGLSFNQRNYRDGVEEWKSDDIELGRKYIGIADSKLRVEYLSAQSE